MELDIHDIEPPPPPFNEKVSPTPKGKAKKTPKPSSTHMTTHSATKASASYTSMVGSPSTSPSVVSSAASSLTPSDASFGLVFAPSQSDVSIPHVPYKINVVVLDTSATSLEKSFFSL